MADSKSDIVMKFVLKGGVAVPAESMLDAPDSDHFMDGFHAITGYNGYSNFFEVKTFNFTLTVAPDDTGIGALSQSGGQADPFSRWRSAKGSTYEKIDFPIKFDKFSFTRAIDGASPVFFSACCNQESFQSATLVKRVATSRKDGGYPRGFLRLDFRDVLLTSLSWSDGDLVEETATFICKALRLRYKRQAADGSLDPSSAEANWDQTKNG